MKIDVHICRPINYFLSFTVISSAQGRARSQEDHEDVKELGVPPARACRVPWPHWPSYGSSLAFLVLRQSSLRRALKETAAMQEIK